MRFTSSMSACRRGSAGAVRPAPWSSVRIIDGAGVLPSSLCHDLLHARQQAVRPPGAVRRGVLPAQPGREGRPRRPERGRQDDALPHDRGRGGARRGRRLGAEEAHDRLLPPGRRGDEGPLGARRGDRRQRPARRPAPRARGAPAGDDATPRGRSELDEILARFGEVQEEYDHKGGYALEAQAREVLARARLRRRAHRRRRRRALRRLEDARRDGARAAGPARRAADGRAHEPPRHRVDPVARGLPQGLPGRALHDLARPRVHEPDRDPRSPRSTTARSPPTRATTTSTSASARSATRTARPPTRASRRCSPRRSASSSASRPTPRRRRRCRAA